MPDLIALARRCVALGLVLVLFCCQRSNSGTESASATSPRTSEPAKSQATEVSIPAGTVCELSGKSGDVATCSLELLRKEKSQDNAVIVRLGFNYPVGALQPTAYAHCRTEAECSFQPLTERSVKLPNGHVAATCLLKDPKRPTGGCKPGDLVLLIYGLESKDITSAYSDSTGKIHGDPSLIRLQFMLKTDGKHHLTSTGNYDLQATNAQADKMGITVNQYGTSNRPAQLVSTGVISK